jgi:hypothetical protein
LKSAAKKAPDYISQPAQVFMENIHAALKTAGIPETFAKVSVATKEFESLAVRHRILVMADSLTVENLGRDETPEERTERNELAQKKALQEFQDGAGNPAIRRRLMQEAINFLSNNLEDQNMQMAVKELLRQTVVMIWGAFEVLCRDVFVGHLNSNPTEVQKLTADSDTKKIFQAKAIGLEELSEYDFDVSRILGNVLINAYDFSSLGAIRQTFKVLFPFNKDLLDHLSDHKLWILHQRRHLIVHRRAFVDKQYLEKTDEKIKTGEQMTPTPAEIQEYINLFTRPHSPWSKQFRKNKQLRSFIQKRAGPISSNLNSLNS